MTLKSLNENTPITTAFALTLCYVCYWIGAETSAQRVRLEASEQTQRKLGEVVERIADITAGNARRIDVIEQRIQP